MSVEAAEALGRLRRELRDVIGADLPPGRCGDALLAVTELVTNSLVHAAPGPVTVWAWLDAGRLRVEVHDAGPGIPADQDWTMPCGDAVGGRGLALVRLLTDRCGHRAQPWAMAWIEVDRGGEDGPSPPGGTGEG